MVRKKNLQEVTIIDVAEAAGVSYSTVSRVVNNKPYVKEETREKVLRVMDELGYEVNLQARSLAGGRTNVIGLVVLDLATQYITEIIRGVDQVLAANEHELLLYTTHQDKAKESAYVNMMARGLADALVIVLPRDPEAYIASLRNREFPYVLIDQLGTDDRDLCVTADNRGGGFVATRHLLDLGHRRIGIITGWMDMVSARHRLEGYKDALAAFHIPYDENLVVIGDFTEESGVRGANHLMDLARPPTAIFASNDVMAMGVLDTLHARGLRVPEEVSIIGFDDIPVASYLTPRLTTVKQPLVDFGRQAMQMLLSLLDGSTDARSSLILPTELIIRESTSVPLSIVRV